MPAGLILAAAMALTPPQGGVRPDERSAYDAMVAAQARAANASFTGSACDDAKVEVVSITPGHIANDPNLIVWREKVRVTGCGHSAVENLNIGRTGGDPPWRMTTGLPGSTLADMTLQASTFSEAVKRLSEVLPDGCQSIRLDDVYISARPGDVVLSPPGVTPSQPRAGHPAIELPEAVKPMLDKLALSEAWMEVWPFAACGHDRTLGVVFIPLKDHSASAHLFLPIWPQIEAHGPGARPTAVKTDE
jgi:hypothetical protein